MTTDAHPTTEPILEVRDLTKRYGHKLVLDRLSLEIYRGETLVLIGGSGSGKSTFARLLVGLERPTSGLVRVFGVELDHLHERALAKVQRRMGVVFQRHALLDSMTVFDNVAFALREDSDLSEQEIVDRADRALAELGVAEAAHQLPGELSGGMAKRVAIARAVVTEPEILVYDEPTTGLDPMNARMVDGLIERMREQHLVTSVVITHDMVTAYDVADRVALLVGGRIAACGPPEDIFRSHDAQVRPFAESSGLDLDRLGPRRARKSAAEIRARWSEHPHGPLRASSGWLRRRHSAA
jgi:phospholipid/cholesterol/gamma-HCH transport system ATP-binding protein